MSKKLVFFTNILSHYQLSLSREFINIYGSDYCFIATEPFPQEMLGYGVPDLNQESFVLRAYESPEAHSQAMAIAEEAECLIFCGIPADIEMTARRAQKGKITFEYSERLFKNFGLKQILWILAARFSPLRRHVLKRKLKGILVPPPNNNIYLLCAGAFTYNDYRACGYYRDKAFKWGYFPETKYYDNVEALISQKEPASILWAGRCIDWKHPELAVLLAEKLRAENLPFTMTIIGQGNMSEEIARLVHERKLDECVNLPGALPPEEVRRYMERSQIFLFTSDRHEGWGCVLNEAMNSGCAVVAGEKIGAVPYLLKHGKNGLVFRDRDIDDLTLKVRELLMKPAQIAELGRNACRTITEEWSPRIAAERFVKLQESLSRGEGRDIFASGPCSMAGYSV